MLLRRALTALLAIAGLLAFAPAAGADTVSPTTAPVLRFFSYNICGNWTCSSKPDETAVRTDKVLSETLAWRSDLVFLQEVCASQFDEIRTALAPHGYSGYFKATLTPDIDPDPARDLCNAGSGESDYGIAVLAKGPLTNVQYLDLATGAEKGQEEWYAACVDATVQGRTTRACSVHLYSDLTDIAAAQAVKLAAHADSWIDQNIPVVLAGDFNPRFSGGQALAPQSKVLDSLYSHSGGTGRFIEADESDASWFNDSCRALNPPSGRCRSGEPTLPPKNLDPAAKLDYVFLSEAHFKNVAADALPQDPVVSDHHPYRAAASWSFCNNPDDGKADMLRQDSAGDLWRHFGRADGTLAALPCKVATGLGDAREIARGADHDGDGAQDLYTIDSAGDLYFHRGHSTELFFVAPRKVGWGWGPATSLLSTADMNGDGRSDLLAVFGNGDLYLVPGNGDGTLGAKIRISGGWQNYATVLAPGDVNGDAKPDVVARDAAGGLYMYPGRSDGSLAARVQIGQGWRNYVTVLAPGDVNGDTKPDLLARDSAGTLWFHAGTAAHTFAPAVKSGWGFSTTDLIL